jgi:cytochrome c-type biogenesis protein CcmE
MEPAETDIAADAEGPRGIPPWVKIGSVFVVLAGAMLFLLLGTDASDALVYSRLVDQVVADPDAHVGRPLRVEGDLRQGSVAFRESPCEWRFVIEKNERSLPVRFPECVVPDTFRDDYGIEVTVQGALQADGTFLANEVVAKCPSRYEEKMRRGEKMPDHRELPSRAL